MTLICGIDEAGKGPVIGPLVVCGITIKTEDEHKLKELGVNDSKLLTPKKREFLYPQILKIIENHELVISSPQEIDAALQSPDTNLLWFEADYIAAIINKLKPNTAVVDCPTGNIPAFDEYVKKKLNVDCKLISEHKADQNHLTVAAASIIAKVTRDRIIEEIKLEVGDFGSGYPSDPKTKIFIQHNYLTHAKIFRKTWKTYKNVIASKEQKGLGDF